MTVTLFNDDSDRALSLLGIRMHGDDPVFSPSLTLLHGLGPDIAGDTVRLGKGESVTLVIPYFMDRDQFPTRWRTMDQGPYYMIVGVFTDIRLR